MPNRSRVNQPCRRSDFLLFLVTLIELFVLYLFFKQISDLEQRGAATAGGVPSLTSGHTLRHGGPSEVDGAKKGLPNPRERPSEIPLPETAQYFPRAGDIPSKKSRQVTDQACYIRSDESELCEFNNVVCWDGQGPVAVVPDPVRSAVEHAPDDYSKCFDFGNMEPTSFEFSYCSPFFSNTRQYAYPDDLRGDMRVDHSLPLSFRRWGPLGRGDSMHFREVSPWEVFGPRGSSPIESSLSDDLILELHDKGGSPGLHTRIMTAPSTAQEHEDKEREARHRLFLEQLGYNSPEQLADFEPLFSRPPAHEVTVDWVQGALWFIDSPAFDNYNPFHWVEKLGPLWETQRANGSHSIFDDWSQEMRNDDSHWGSHPLDAHLLWTPLPDASVNLGSRLHPSDCAYRGGSRSEIECHPDSPRTSTRIGGFGRLPPQSYLLFASEAVQRASGDDENTFLQLDWNKKMLELMAQPGHKVISPGVSASYSKKHLFCSTRGVMTTIKPRVFSGRSDAYVLRNAAYVKSNILLNNEQFKEEMKKRRSADADDNAWESMIDRVRGEYTIPSHPRFPPRRILFLIRSGGSRAFANLEEMVQLAQSLMGPTLPGSLGIPSVQVVEIDSSYSFEDQVRLMSNTGILVAVHGAGLTNSIFLPSGSSVIEIFPWKFVKHTYRYLCSNLGLHYQGIVTLEPPDPLDMNEETRFASDLVYSEKFFNKCVKNNLSASEFNFQDLCNAAVSAVETNFAATLLIAVPHLSPTPSLFHTPTPTPPPSAG